MIAVALLITAGIALALAAILRVLPPAAEKADRNRADDLLDPELADLHADLHADLMAIAEAVREHDGPLDPELVDAVDLCLYELECETS